MWWKRRARWRLRADRFAFAFAFGLFADEVGLGRRVVAGAGDRDDVQRVVELAITAAV